MYLISKKSSHIILTLGKISLIKQIMDIDICHNNWIKPCEECNEFLICMQCCFYCSICDLMCCEECEMIHDCDDNLN